MEWIFGIIITNIILQKQILLVVFAVTPLAGVWIEMSVSAKRYLPVTSLPLREYGLNWGFAILWELVVAERASLCCGQACL